MVERRDGPSWLRDDDDDVELRKVNYLLLPAKHLYSRVINVNFITHEYIRTKEAKR